MHEQANEQFWDWVAHESKTSVYSILGKYNTMVTMLAKKYAISPDVREIHEGKYHSRTTFNITEMQYCLSLLDKDIKSGLKEKPSQATNEAPQDFDTSWLKI